MPQTVSDLGERALISRLRTRLPPSPSHVRIGIGDDAAVIAPERGAQDVITTDSLVEHVHFRRDWTRADAIGHKALAVNLSDIAAMGATPRASLLSLVLPDDYPVADFDGLLDGYAQLAAASGAVLVGGNIARSPGPLIVDVTVVGNAHPRRLLTRGGARPGDALYVTGAVGASSAGLALLEAGVDRAVLSDDERACVQRHERPDARLRIGRLVGRTSAASAAMDLSDGLADAARGIAAASGVGVVIDADAVPVHPAAKACAERRGQTAVQFALAGGEDYEIAFAVPSRLKGRFRNAAHRCPDLHVTCIGRFEATPGAWLEENGRRSPLPEGFGHFSAIR